MEGSLMHSIMTLERRRKAMLHGIDFAGSLGNNAQISACCRYKYPAATRPIITPYTTAGIRTHIPVTNNARIYMRPSGTRKQKQNLQQERRQGKYEKNDC
uniref:Uncharacterized protein n=1 Tax=Arundo donax TaxID=35708 RepID=A0A0A9D4J7_ARUDO